MTTVRGALGNRFGDVAAWLVVTAPTARPELISRIEMVFIVFSLSWSSVAQRLDSLPLGKPLDALGESVLLDEFGPAYPVLWFCGEFGVASVVEIERDNIS